MGEEAAGISAIVFDLGGVLIDWDPRHLYRRIFRDEVAMETFLATVCTPEWNAEQDAGRSWREAVETLAARFPEQRPLIQAYDERWPETINGPIVATVDILAELRAAGWPLYALSNWSAEKFPIAQARFDFLGWFDGLVISGRVGVRKPGDAIFRLLLERHGLSAPSTLFIDDIDENVAAARRSGFQAIHFKSAEALRADLVSLRVLPATTGGTPRSGSASQPSEARTR